MANIVKRNGGTPGTMAMEPWDPFRAMRDLMRWDPFREIAPISGRIMRERFEPSFDVRETKDGFVIKADLPGIKPEDVEVTLTGNRLQITGRREEELESEEDTYYVCERYHGGFTRVFTLPEGIDADHVRSEVRDGVLTLAIPKRPEAQPKKIAIGQGQGGQGGKVPRS